MTVLGSRCGPFPDAINALVRRHVDVLSMISRQFPLSRIDEALSAARDPDYVKVLLKVDE